MEHLQYLFNWIDFTNTRRWIKVGNENILDAPETRLTETETVDVRGKEDRCFWSGTAPFCQGYCPSAVYVTKASDKCGDGKCCMTGTKKYCCPK